MGKGIGVVKTKITEDKLRKQLINRARTNDGRSYWIPGLPVYDPTFDGFCEKLEAYVAEEMKRQER